MDALVTSLYLLCFFGVMGGIAYGLDYIWQAHKRGLERLRAYDLRQESN